MDLSMGGVNVWVENLQDCGLLEKTARAAVGRNWTQTPLRLKKMKVGSVDVHVIGIDKRLPALVKTAFLGYEHFRSSIDWVIQQRSPYLFQDGAFGSCPG